MVLFFAATKIIVRLRDFSHATFIAKRKPLIERMERTEERLFFNNYATQDKKNYRNQEVESKRFVIELLASNVEFFY